MPFKFIKLPELDFDLKAVTTEDGRRYSTPTGEMYPSVTTVLADYNKKAIMVLNCTVYVKRICWVNCHLKK